MNFPNDRLYTKEHEWIKIDGDSGVIGITEHAQHALGDVTFVDLPKIGAQTKQFDTLMAVESVKAASDIYAPLSGEVTQVNTPLENNPGLINQSCYEDGWLAKIRIKDPGEKKNLMDSPAYQKHVEGLQH
jgi:glycine cleavage system H protein